MGTGKQTSTSYVFDLDVGKKHIAACSTYVLFWAYLKLVVLAGRNGRTLQRRFPPIVSDVGWPGHHCGGAGHRPGRAKFPYDLSASRACRRVP